MQLSETIKLYMTKEQKALVIETMNQYINTVNSLVSVAINGNPSVNIQRLMLMPTFHLL